MSNEPEGDLRGTHYSLVQAMNDCKKAKKNQESILSFRKSPFYQKQRSKQTTRPKSFIRSNSRQMSMFSNQLPDGHE